MLRIDEILGDLRAMLATHTNVVLEAPPGAGKTTRVPLALLDAPWLEGLNLVMLEPRRLAARAAATFMAGTLGERVGERVGYRIRGDSRVSRETRIEVVTEGVLARMLASDPALERYGAVIFDEFHERSLHADLGLALTLESQQHLRESLRILVMSATLDGNDVARLIGGATPAPVVRSAGRMFPVATHYRPPRAAEYPDAAIARTIREAVTAHAGDVLVFLPGAVEQRRVAGRLDGDPALRTAAATVHVLHGAMPMHLQDVALAPAPPGQRKIVLATSVAETSLTIEGVRVVVDGGLSRLPRYEPRLGLTRLETVRVSRASADQRRGRAGRVAPGDCYRVWDAHEEFGFAARTRPEILDADLTPLALELADAGITDASALRWLDPPPQGAFSAARETLTMLGALDAAGRITAHGREMAALPLQPRLAHLMLRARARGVGDIGSELAALLEERDILRTDGRAPSDMRLRIEAVRRSGGDDARGDRDAIDRVRHSARELRRRAGIAGNASATATAIVDARKAAPVSDVNETGILLAAAFPDRVAKRRLGREARYVMRNGAGVSLPETDPLASSEWLAVADLDGTPPEYRVARAAPLTRDEVLAEFAPAVVRDTQVEWDDRTESVRAFRRVRLGAIVIDEAVVGEMDPESVRDVLLAEIRRRGIAALPWTKGASALRERIAFVHHHDASWPDTSDAALDANLDWLVPSLDGVRRWSELERLDLHDALLGTLSWQQRSALDALAPVAIEVPSGSRKTVDYSDVASPTLAVKLQEVFGWTRTPMVLGGRVPLTLQLLSPAQRPVQVTRDLEGFWRTSYFDVRKELRGRYPRHPWPEDPLTAEPTRRAKPRGT